MKKAKWNTGLSFLNAQLALLVLMAVVLATSCTKDINLKLPNATPHIVIEGNITDQPGPYTIHVTNTATYYDTANFSAVLGAKVIVSDNAGNTDTLVPASPGIYQTHPKFQGVPGRTYSMRVISQGAEYDATSTMPPPVPIDTLGVKNLAIVGFNITVVYCEFKDPANGMLNYYRITTYQDTVTNVDDRAYSDQFTQGSEQLINLETDNNIKSGDSIVVVLQTIDQGVYNYFNTLRSNTNGQNAAPANPVSNITNNALGYFSACGVTSKSIKVP